jgi:hypothetical protein
MSCERAERENLDRQIYSCWRFSNGIKYQTKRAITMKIGRGMFLMFYALAGCATVVFPPSLANALQCNQVWTISYAGQTNEEGFVVFEFDHDRLFVVSVTGIIPDAITMVEANYTKTGGPPVGTSRALTGNRSPGISLYMSQGNSLSIKVHSRGNPPGRGTIVGCIGIE